MALVTKTLRCALCGSSDVVYCVEGRYYHCDTCGGTADSPMPAADLAAVNRIATLGGSEEEWEALRRRYPRLGMASWSSENRLQVK